MSFVKKFKESLKNWGGSMAACCEDDDYMARPISENIKKYFGLEHKDWKGHEDWERVFVNAILMQELDYLMDGPLVLMAITTGARRG